MGYVICGLQGKSEGKQDAFVGADLCIQVIDLGTVPGGEGGGNRQVFAVVAGAHGQVFTGDPGNVLFQDGVGEFEEVILVQPEKLNRVFAREVEIELVQVCWHGEIVPERERDGHQASVR